MKILLKLFSLKFIAALLGLGYSILQVRYFGASRTIEIYFAAQTLVYLVTSLTQSGQLAEIFLPEYHSLNSIKPKLGFQGLNIVINRMLLWAGLIMTLVFLLAPYFILILVPGFSETDQAEATLIFRILLPYLFLQVVNSFFITVLNAEQKFGRAEFLGLTNTIVNILVLIFLFSIIGVWALVLSLLLGKIIEFYFYVFQLKKIGFKYQFSLSIPEFDHVFFFKTMQSTFLYVGATQFYSFVLTASISFLPEGTFAIFKYVQNLGNKIKGLMIQPFMTIFFTNYSNLIQRSKSVFKEFTKNMGSIINVSSITIIGAILLGDIFINLLWGGKKFDSSNVQLAYVFLIFNIVTVLISSVGEVYRKMSVAHGKAKRLYYFWVIAQLTSAGLSYFLIKYFNENGLFFIIPINAFLMGVMSYYVYKQTTDALEYNFLNWNNFIAIISIIIAIVIKYYSFSIETQQLTIIVLISFSILLTTYPFMNTYKLYKN
jgi:putative peptidoglycan lipid II flippase